MVGILKKGGRKHGGFSKFQNRRQILGYPSAWKPKSIFGGVDDEGANNLIVQRLTGLIELDGFEVSHQKDAILYEGDEEDLLEKYLEKQTKSYRDYASRRRGPRANPWARDKLKDLVANMKQEFESSDFKDTLNTAVLPPLATILANNRQQVASLAPADKLGEFDILPGLRVVLSEQERSEHDPYVTIEADAQPGTIHVIINGLHTYYGNHSRGWTRSTSASVSMSMTPSPNSRSSKQPQAQPGQCAPFEGRAPPHQGCQDRECGVCVGRWSG